MFKSSYLRTQSNGTTSNLVNVRAVISVIEGQFELAGFIRNATNERYLLDAGNTGGAFGIPTFIPAEPRFYGAQLAAKFQERASTDLILSLHWHQKQCRWSDILLGNNTSSRGIEGGAPLN